MPIENNQKERFLNDFIQNREFEINEVKPNFKGYHKELFEKAEDIHINEEEADKGAKKDDKKGKDKKAEQQIVLN